jgi:hypothetical protein
MSVSPFANQIGNRNFLSPVGFKFTLAKEPKVTFFCNSTRIPEINLEVVQQPSYLKDIDVPGDKLTFDPLTLNFIVQENLANYIEIYNWMFGIGHPQSLDSYKTIARSSPNNSNRVNIYSDATLFILSNKQNPIAKVTFVDVYPTALSPLQYDASVTDVTPITTDVTLNYSYYKLETI